MQNFDPAGMVKGFENLLQRLTAIESVLAPIIPQAGVALTVTDGVATLTNDVAALVDKIDPGLLAPATASSAIATTAEALKKHAKDHGVKMDVIPDASGQNALPVTLAPKPETAAPTLAKKDEPKSPAPLGGALPPAPPGFHWEVIDNVVALVGGNPKASA